MCVVIHASSCCHVLPVCVVIFFSCHALCCHAAISCCHPNIIMKIYDVKTCHVRFREQALQKEVQRTLCWFVGLWELLKVPLLPASNKQKVLKALDVKSVEHNGLKHNLLPIEDKVVYPCVNLCGLGNKISL